ncbi:MAG TPA: hypothetical protein VKY89_15470, partial [Thermoanaerobaculia bacterium]|nr:hypothetical protein [Thermoanaerobaculia bacterium]
CLLGHWGARTHLDDVCIWLWDMVRYRLYNINDAHDMNAGRWAAQHKHLFPLEAFDLRAAASAPAQPPVRDDQDLADSIVLHRDAEA